MSAPRCGPSSPPLKVSTSQAQIVAGSRGAIAAHPAAGQSVSEPVGGTRCCWSSGGRTLDPTGLDAECCA